MPTTLNKSNHSEFIPQLWLSRALGFLHQNAIMASLVNRDYEPEFQAKGDTVNVPIVGNLVANDKLVDTPTTKQTTTGAKVPVLLNYHKEATFIVEDIAKAQSNPDLLDSYVRKAAIAIANDIDRTLTAQYANVGTSMVVGSSSVAINEDTILDGREILNEMEIPYDQRVIVVRDYHDLLQIDRFTRADSIGNGEAIRSGLIGTIHGFRCYEDPRIWRVTGSGGGTHNLMFHRDGIVLATRALPPPPDGLGTIGEVLEMDGIVMRLTYSYNHDYLGVQCTLDVLYGVKVIHHPTDQTIWKAPLIDLVTNH